jgi:hypothetical protein
MSLSSPRLKRADVTFLLHEAGGIAIDAARSGDIRLLAGVAELVDAPDLGSGDANHGGSIPSARTSSTPSRDCVWPPWCSPCCGGYGGVNHGDALN